MQTQTDMKGISVTLTIMTFTLTTKSWKQDLDAARWKAYNTVSTPAHTSQHIHKKIESNKKYKTQWTQIWEIFLFIHVWHQQNKTIKN